MDTLRFLQFPDLHFQNREYETQLECSQEKAEIVEREMREVVEKMVTLAKERRVLRNEITRLQPQPVTQQRVSVTAA